MTISLEDVVLLRGPKTLVNGFSTVIGNSDRIGVFGPNGAGKSSLLQAIRGDLDVESGRIVLSPPGTTAGYLPQLRGLPAQWNVLQALRRRTGVAAAEERLELAAARLATDSSVAAGDEYERAVAAFMSLGADSLEDRAPAVLAEVGSHLPLDRTCEGLSGGELARVGLASVLLSHFDALLLDEPTNDLDEAGLHFLTEFVIGRSGPLLLVSHDRRFLEATITGVIEFDPQLDHVVRFDGGYDAWLRERARAQAAAVAENEQYAQTVDDLKAQAAAIRRRSARGVRTANRAYEQGRVDKLLRDRMVDGATAGAASARTTQRQLKKLEKPDGVRKVWHLKLSFPVTNRAAAAFVLDEATVTRGGFAVGPLSLAVSPGERVRVHGRNGSGKSLLIDALTQRVPPTTGRASCSSLAEVGVLDQQRSLVPSGDRSLAQWFPTVADMQPVEARTILAKFGLDGEDVSRPMATLSPGERTRVGLALLASRQTSALVLDEPTNHLDLPAIEQLEAALADYSGTLIVVTHDEAFADQLSFDRLVTLDGVVITDTRDSDGPGGTGPSPS